MKTTIFSTLSILFLTGAGLYGQSEVAVIVNNANPPANLSKSQLCKMILGEQPKWPSGGKLSIVLPSVGAPERATVLRSICDMSESEMNQHLLHANFNGDQATATSALPVGAIRSVVSAVPGALGFIRAADVSAAVKVVKLDGSGPGESGYKVK